MAHDPQDPKEVAAVKKVLLIVVVAALALTLVPLAIAGGHGGGGRKHGRFKFNLVGSVVAPDVVDPAVDPAVTDVTELVDPSTITIRVKAGSHIKGLRGTVKTFDVAAGARVWRLTADGAVEMTLGDVADGDWVKVKGKISKDGLKVYTITSIKYRDLTPEPAPEPAPDPSTPPAAQ